MKKLFIFILMVMINQSTFADSWTDRGNYSISWFDKSKKSFVINTPAELAGVAYLVNNGYTTFKDVTLFLGEDIFLNDHEWTAIGTNLISCFQGTFDGNSHSIYDVRMSKDSFKENKYMGFFACLIGASVKNLYIQYNDFTLDNVLRTEINIGKITGYAEDCEIRNVSAAGYFSWRTGEISPYMRFDNLSIGGLIGKIKKSTLYNCRNGSSGLYIEIGALYAYDYYKSIGVSVGGIVGSGDDDVYTISSIYGCENRSSIEVRTGCSFNGLPYVSIGGIVGNSIGSTHIESCYNNAPNFICKNTGNKGISASIGGIAGCDFTGPYSKGYIHNCYSSTKDITYGVWLHTQAYLKYGGISAIYKNGTNNLYSSTFSPYDITVTPYNVGDDAIPLRNGFNGDNSFSSEEMKSQAFLDMLNEYSIIQEGKCIWENRKIGEDFPSLIIEKASGIKNVMADLNIMPNYSIANNVLTIDYSGKLIIYNSEGLVVYNCLSYKGESIRLGTSGIYIVNCNKHCFKILIK